MAIRISWVVALLGLTGCDRVFGLDPRAAPPDAPRDATPGGDLTIAAPSLFEADAPAGIDAYLFEGTSRVPLVTTGLGDDDTVRIKIPTELGTGWLLCDQPVEPGDHDLSELPAPCARQGGVLAVTITVPISTTVGATGSVTPLVVTVTRDGVDRDLPITIFPLDELMGAPVVRDRLYARIRLPAVTPAKGGGRLMLRSTSDIEITGLLDLRGGAGQSHAAANNCGNLGTGCTGGDPGPGSTARGGSTGCAAAPAAPCPAAQSGVGIGGGSGGAQCNSGGICRLLAATGGGGGGGALGGGFGEGSTTTACTAIQGGLAGAAVDDPLVLALRGGGGGGGGGGLFHLTQLNGGGGGGGGGVIALDALGTIRFTTNGKITARGGDGGVGITGTCNASAALRAGTGGAGGGGAIRLRAAMVESVADLDELLVVQGGGSAQGTISGVGSVGSIRIDGLGADTLNTQLDGVVRGPDFDVPLPVVRDDTLMLTARARSGASTFVYSGVRLAGATSYTLQATAAGAGAVAVPVPLEVGLNEVCVFVDAQASTAVAVIPAAAKRCTWVARVESP